MKLAIRRTVIVLILLFVGVKITSYIFTIPRTTNPTVFAYQEFAQRAGYFFGPENTLETARKSIEMGVKAIEVDLQLSKDSVLFLFHDVELDRATNGTGKAEDYTIAELKELQVKNPDGTLSEAHIIDLETFLDSLPEDVLLKLDVKFYTENTYTLMKELVLFFYNNDIHERAFISCFDPRITYMVKKQDSRIITAHAFVEKSGKGWFIDKALNSHWLPTVLGVDIVEPNRSIVTKSFLKYCQRQGYVVNAWTINTAEWKRKAKEWNISITTNCPTLDCEDYKEDSAFDKANS